MAKDEDDSNLPEGDDEELLSVRVTYVCEDCDYRWEEEVEPKVKENYSNPEDLDVHTFHRSCPMCGSHSIDLDEG